MKYPIAVEEYRRISPLVKSILVFCFVFELVASTYSQSSATCIIVVNLNNGYTLNSGGLRATSHKYRPISTFGGTSGKIDFVHILLIDRP